jgi:hypothetical protein
MPCTGCGAGGEPALRRPRHLSEAWYRDPATYFGCRQCGRHLAAIEGPAASRPSEVAIDGVPDPEGTLRAFMIRDPLAPLRQGPSTGGRSSLLMRSILGPPFAGIELRSRVTVRRPGVPGRVVPFAFTRHGLPWVVWRAVEVEDARVPPCGIAVGGLGDLLEVESVEAAFTVLVDATAGGQAIRTEPRGPGHGPPA